jgi:hypothetical protein
MWPTAGGFSMRAAQILVLAAFIVAIAATSAPAHHSFSAEFDRDKPFKMTGKVTEVKWMNPHTFFYIDVVDEKTRRSRTGVWKWAPRTS